MFEMGRVVPTVVPLMRSHWLATLTALAAERTLPSPDIKGEANRHYTSAINALFTLGHLFSPEPAYRGPNSIHHLPKPVPTPNQTSPLHLAQPPDSHIHRAAGAAIEL